MKNLIFKLIILACGLSILIGTIIYANNNKSTSANIVAADFASYDFARAVVGDASKVKMLLKPGTEAHDYEPSPQDIKDITAADFFIYNGGESEEWVANVLKDNNVSEDKTIKLMDIVDLKKEDGEDEYDEHIWTNPLNAVRIVERIRDRLVAKNSVKLDEYTNNAKKYTDKLMSLDGQIREIVANAKRKKLVFADRFPFRYFVDEYGLEYVAAFPGCSHQTEASSSKVAELIDLVKTEQISAVLKIELTSDALAQTIAKETGAKILTLAAAHNISQEDFNAGKTYADIMESNLATLKEALN